MIPYIYVFFVIVGPNNVTAPHGKSGQVECMLLGAIIIIGPEILDLHDYTDSSHL